MFDRTAMRNPRFRSSERVSRTSGKTGQFGIASGALLASDGADDPSV